MTNCLVTGGAGFIGSHLVKGLVERGDRVRVLDNLSEGKLENLAGVLDQVELIRGDLRNEDDVGKAVKGIETIYHQAALRSVPKSVLEPENYHDVNVTGTFRLLMAARDAGVRRLVYASSSSVYGGVTTPVQSESQMPMPISPYAVSKLANEFYARCFTQLYRLETVGMRYFNVFGPGQDPASEYAAVVPRFIIRALEDTPLEVHGDGLQSRDFTYIDNVVQFNLRAAEAPNAVGEVFNVGCGDSLSVMDIKSNLERLMGKELDCYHTAARAGDARFTRADTSKAAEMLGYWPLVNFEEGLRHTLDYFQNQPKPA